MNASPIGIRTLGHLLARPHAVPLAAGRRSVSQLIRSAVIRIHAFILRDPHPPHALASGHRPAIGSDKLPSQRRDVARTTSVGSPAFPSSSFCAHGGSRGGSTRSRTQPVPFGSAMGNGRRRATPHRLEDAGPAKSHFPAAACPASQDSAGIVEGVDRCLLSRSFCSRRERRRPRLGGDFGRAGAQRRRSGALARRWSRRVGEHLLPRLAAKTWLESFSREGWGRVAIDS